MRGGDRTKEIPVAEWERVYRKEAQERRLLHQARVLTWGKEKRYYYTHKPHEVILWLVVVVTVRRERRWTLPPANWFAPPDGNRSRLFLATKKHSFLGISLRAATSGAAPVSLRGGERKHLLTTIIHL